MTKQTTYGILPLVISSSILIIGFGIYFYWGGLFKRCPSPNLGMEQTNQTQNE